MQKPTLPASCLSDQGVTIWHKLSPKLTWKTPHRLWPLSTPQVTFPQSGWVGATWPVTARRRLDRSGCEKGGKQHAMRVIKGSPRRQARAGDRAQGRSAADSGFVSGDLAPLTRRWSQRKRLPVGRPCRQCPFRESGDRLRTTKLCDLAPLVAKKRNATAGEPPAPPAHYTLYWVRTAGRIYKSPGRTVAANFQ